MTITLTSHQERVIQDAIRSGLVKSVDAFIQTAVEALPRSEAVFDGESARQAGEQIRQLRKGVHLGRQSSMSIRELAHSGHKY